MNPNTGGLTDNSGQPSSGPARQLEGKSKARNFVNWRSRYFLSVAALVVVLLIAGGAYLRLSRSQPTPQRNENSLPTPALPPKLKKVFSIHNYRLVEFSNKSADQLRVDYLDVLNALKTDYRVREYYSVSVDQNLVRSLLQNGEAVFMNGTIGGIPHLRLIVGYENDEFVVCDPLTERKTRITPDQFDEAFNPPFGRWCMTASNRPFQFASIEGRML